MGREWLFFVEEKRESGIEVVLNHACGSSDNERKKKCMKISIFSGGVI